MSSEERKLGNDTREQYSHCNWTPVVKGKVPVFDALFLLCTRTERTILRVDRYLTDLQKQKNESYPSRKVNAFSAFAREKDSTLMATPLSALQLSASLSGPSAQSSEMRNTGRISGLL